MTWTLFEITPERARQISRQRGFLTADERAQLEREQRANREPLPYVPTPEELKRERMATLERRLMLVGKDRGWR